MKTRIQKLNEMDKVIQEIAKDLGLDWFPQEFDVIPERKMIELLAYRFPRNFSHWSFGRDFEFERTKHDYGFGIPYEVVLNTNPSRAFLININPFPIQVLVMAHVYAHNNFMKNNIHFAPTRRDVLTSVSSAATRFREYEEIYGLDEVEKIIDAGMALQYNTNFDFFIKDGTEERSERLKYQKTKKRDPLDDFFPKKPDGKEYKKRQKECLRRTPMEPDRDILLYIIKNAPLEDWQKDILSVIRDQMRYLYPQMRTKIMNEGWATYWHMRIMNRLFEQGYLTAEDHGYYSLYNSRVLAMNKYHLNPYIVGLKIWEDIEDRWNKGKFGKEYRECDDLRVKEKWDKKLGLGKEKIFKVRDAYSDRFFFEEFLTEKLVDDLDLYIYASIEHPDGSITDIIIEDDWQVIKRLLVQAHTTFGIPHIEVTDGNYKGRRELYLKHLFEEAPLDPEYREKTMEHIYDLWQNPVHLETVEIELKIPEDRLAILSDIFGSIPQKILDELGIDKKEKGVIYTYDGKKHTVWEIELKRNKNSQLRLS